VEAPLLRHLDDIGTRCESHSRPGGPASIRGDPAFFLDRKVVESIASIKDSGGGSSGSSTTESA